MLGTVEHNHQTSLVCSAQAVSPGPALQPGGAAGRGSWAAVPGDGEELDRVQMEMIALFKNLLIPLPDT